MEHLERKFSHVIIVHFSYPSVSRADRNCMYYKKHMAREWMKDFGAACVTTNTAITTFR